MATDEKQLLEYLKKVTIELHDTRAQLAEVERAAQEPIAIVGIGCRYPGGVRTAEQLWGLVAAGQDAISGFPVDRGWDLDSVYDLEASEADRVCNGGFLDELADFDAGFFGIGAGEALMMDPQQRLLLEVSWEAIEHGAIDPTTLRDSQTGVFAGFTIQDYAMWLMSSSSVEELSGYATTGTGGGVISGRIAYVLGLRGPAITLDTACSSSLVTIHLACRSLRAGECSMALAGGVTAMATAMTFSSMGLTGALAADGRCKSFAAAADGMVPAEGAGMVLLERLEDARRHGHEVLAVIRGSAINQDGASNGLTAPNGSAQERVIRMALADANLTADQVDAVEAHGTGTELGDPIELEAIMATYGQGRSASGPLWLGSLKSNIGHTLAAAGVAGVIKTVMALQSELLPQTLHVEEPTDQVDWSLGDVSLLTEPVPWPRGAEPRRAGVSSFGVSGTNAHIIVEEAPAKLEVVEHVEGVEGVALGLGPGRAMPWILSAKTDRGLCAQAASLREWVAGKPRAEELDLAFSLATTRPAFESRAVVVGERREQLLSALAVLEREQAAADVVQDVAPTAVGRVAFVFPGHGSQWPGMASELLASSPAFAKHMEACEQVLAAELGWSPIEVLKGTPGAPPLEATEVVQPVLFAMMVSLARLWGDCGVRAQAVVGHSQGEIAAAHLAGGLSLADAAKLIARRGRVLAGLTDVGRMAAVALGARELEARLERWSGRIVIAAVNGPCSTVVSGEAEALLELLGECAADGVRVQEVTGAHPAHSPLMERLREPFLEASSDLAPRQAEIAFYSTVTTERSDNCVLDADYWYRNVREPVRFEQTMRSLLQDGFRTFVELSPHPILSVAMTDTIDDALAEPDEARVIGSLRRGEGGMQRLLTSLGEAWAHGVEVDWEAVFAASGATKRKLPTYSFQRKRYWSEPIVEQSGLSVSRFSGGNLSGVSPPASSSSAAQTQTGVRESLRHRLSGVSAGERREILLQAVCEQLVELLGDHHVEEIDPDGNLLELGFDSIGAVELARRLNRVTGLRVPPRALFERSTPAALAAYMEGRLSDIGHDAQAGAEDEETLGQASLPVMAERGETLISMLRHARDNGTADRFMGVLTAASEFRPTFDADSAGEVDLEIVKLSAGPMRTNLICLPTALALSGPHQYVRFAKAIPDDHAVSAVGLPGFTVGARLPQNLEAVVETLALAVDRCSADSGEPFVLLGYSSGGWLANAVAGHLEHRAGATPPMAVVLLDSRPLVDGQMAATMLSALMGTLTGVLTDAMLELLSDDRLTAMGAYIRLLADWRAVETVAPTLFVKAAERLPGMEAADERGWEFDCSEIEAPGNHLTMMEEHGDTTAQAVGEWLSTTLAGQRVMEAG